MQRTGDDLIGQHIGQYQITGRLGEGGMASVYRARQLNITRDVAIKIIKPHLAEAPGFAERFQREAQTIATLSHPHILKLFDYGRQDNLTYFVMELLTGGSLSSLIQRQPMPLERIAKVLDQIAPALEYAHQQGIIHRDLKPQNVLLDANGNATLTDFGIARLLHKTTILTQDGTVMGTPAYMAPEQWRGEPATPQIDIYALGIMLFEMLTGRVPFDGETHHVVMFHHFQTPPPLPTSLRSGLPVEVDQVVALALGKQPSPRFPTATALTDAFRAAIRGDSSAVQAAIAAPALESTFIATDNAEVPTVVDLPPNQSPATPQLHPRTEVRGPKPLTVPSANTAAVPAMPESSTTSPALVMLSLALFAVVAAIGGEFALRLLRSGDTPTSTVGTIVGIVSLVVGIAPLLALLVRPVRARIGRFVVLAVVVQTLLIAALLVGRTPLGNAVSDDLEQRTDQALSAGESKLPGELLKALAMLNPEKARILAGRFNAAGVDAMFSDPPDLVRANVALEAVRDLDEAVDVGRTREEKSIARYNLAQLRELQDQLPQAIDAYRKAILLDDASYEARYALSSLLLITESDNRASLDEAISVARAGWEKYIGDQFCRGKQDLNDTFTFQKTWHCFALLTTEAGARLQRNDASKGDTRAQIETLARRATLLAEANDQFKVQPGYFTAEAYNYLARVTEPDTDVATLCGVVRYYDNTNPRHRPWAEYASQQLGTRTCP